MYERFLDWLIARLRRANEANALRRQEGHPDLLVVSALRPAGEVAMGEPESAWELVEMLTEAEEWRRDQLRGAGFCYLDALELAINPTVDLHFAVGLLERGCSPEVALKILS